MAAPQNFRTAFNGFNRDDVVNYISYITTQLDNQINQLNSELDQLRQELSEKPAAPIVDDSELEALRQQVAVLKTELQMKDETIAQLRTEKAAPAAPAVSPLTEQELNAYRRAESAERRAMERVNQMYAQASGVLADTVSRLEENSGSVAQLADLVRADLTKLEAAILQSKAVLSDSSAVLSAIQPE